MSAPVRTAPAHFVHAARRHGDLEILEDRGVKVTLNALLDAAAKAAEGLRLSGIERGQKVGFYADNSHRWILTDLALQLAGAVSVPRGTDTPPDEMVALFRHAGAQTILVDAARHAQAIEGLRDELPGMGEIICLDPKDAPGRTLDDLIEAGRDGVGFEEAAAAVKPDDLATIIYTSGTTGRPKGVMLTQSNFGHQIATCPGVFRIEAQEKFLSILPPWHIFERTVEYIALCSGAILVYTDRRNFKDDLAKHQPTFVPSVPRIWETVYAGVEKALEHGAPIRRAMFKSAYFAAGVRTRAWDRARGATLRMHKPRGLGLVVDGATRGGALAVAALAWPFDRLGHLIVFRRMRKLVGKALRGAISGGGLMPAHIDRFFRTIELPVLVGYGLTETSPVVAIRRQECNVLGSIGRAVPEVEVQIRSPDTGQALSAGEVGVICTRGPHVMQGYYEDEALTASVIDAAGWLDTGDLGLITEDGDLCFRGRLKETIVLKGGENVEPSSVEESLLTSPLIEQAIVVGQDQKTLLALVLPNRLAVSEALGIARAPLAELAVDPAAQDLLRKECRKRTAARKGYERILRVALLDEELSPESGLLTQTLKLKRHVIVERYADRIREAYDR